MFSINVSFTDERMNIYIHFKVGRLSFDFRNEKYSCIFKCTSKTGKILQVTIIDYNEI